MFCSVFCFQWWKQASVLISVSLVKMSTSSTLYYGLCSHPTRETETQLERYKSNSKSLNFAAMQLLKCSEHRIISC